MKCRICNKANLTTFLSLGEQPLANKYPTPDKFATEEFHNLDVDFCPYCKTVQLDKIISRDQMFVDYYYLSSVNPGLVRHFEQLAEDISIPRPKFVVDIGSNDGILLKPLQKLKIDCVGVEPSKNVSKIANDAGLTTINAFFNHESVELIKSTYGKADIIVASSVFTHLEHPHEFVEDVASLMTGDGLFIVEVEYIGNFIRDIQFERFYFDRIFYYSLTSLKTLFEMHNMRVVDAEKIEPHGGSLRITVVKESSRKMFTQRYAELLDAEKAFTPELLGEFKANVSNAINTFVTALNKFKANGLKVAGYGAPARLATICNYGKIDGKLISFVVDDSPLKAGKTTPGTHIPIVTREHLVKNPVDVLIVFAYEYITDIKVKTKGLTKTYLQPIPTVEL